MMKLVKIIIQVILWLFPWRVRRLCYNIFFKYSINKKTSIGYSIILCKELEMDELSRIGNFNFINKVDKIKLGVDAGIGTFNFITGMPTSIKSYFKHVHNRKCELIMDAHTGITSRHFIDCTGGIYLGEFTTIIGIRTQLFTHSIDIKMNRQDSNPVVFGKYCLVGTNCTILPGSSLPDYSVLSAHSLLNKSYSDSNFLYGGVPARNVKKLLISEVKYFTRAKGNVD